MSHFASFNAMKPSVLQNADRCVFVGDLSFFCTELDLSEAFKHCGAISRLEVKRGRHGDSLLYAFVEFHESSCAQYAIHEMHGYKLLGRRMKVNWTDCRPAPTPGADQWVQVHVNFVSRDLSLKLSEEFLESVFIQFGNIGDIIVKRHSCSTNPAVVSGYAFIYFIDAYAAFRAIHGCKGVNVEAVQFECALSRQYENAMSSQHGTMPRGFKKPSPTHLSSNGGMHMNSMGGASSSPSGHLYNKSYNHHRGGGGAGPYASLPHHQGSSGYTTGGGSYPRGNQFSSYSHMDAALGRAAYPPAGGYPSRGNSIVDRPSAYPSSTAASLTGYPSATPGGRSPSMIATNFPEELNGHLFSKNGMPLSYGYGVGVNDETSNFSMMSSMEDDATTSNLGLSLHDRFVRDDFVDMSSFLKQPLSATSHPSGEDRLEAYVTEGISSLLESS